MFTLIYLKNQFNRPDTLMSFLQSNIGQSPLLRIDCISPYQGTEHDLIGEVCDYLNRIAPEVEVTYNITFNTSTESNGKGHWVHFIEIQLNVTERQLRIN